MRFSNLKAALLALLLGALSLGPALLPGRALLPQDPRAFPPLSTELTGVEVDAAERAAVPHRRDKLFQFLPYDTAVAESWRAGRVPLWESRVLCGFPLLAQATSRAFYPTAFLFALFSPGAVYAWTYLIHLVLGGLFMYRLARAFGASHAGGQLANGAFVLSSYAIAHVHHPMIFFAAIWALPALECTHRIVRRKPGDGAPAGAAVALACAVALSWFAGFSQATVLIAYLIVGLCLTRALEDRRNRLGIAWARLLLPLVAFGIGTGLALVQMLPSLEMSLQSSRAPGALDTMRAIALTPVHLLDLLLPGQLAAPNDMCPAGPELPRPTYLSLWLQPMCKFGPLSENVYNHTETAIGFGFWPLLFAAASVTLIFRRSEKRATVRFLWVVTLLGFAGSMAVPGIVYVLTKLPGFAVGDLKRLLLLPALALPLLAGIGYRDEARPRLVPWLALGVVAIAIGVYLLVLPTDRFQQMALERLAARIGTTVADIESNFRSGESLLNQGLLGRGFVFLGLALAIGPLLSRMSIGSLGFVVATMIELLRISGSVTPAPPLASLDAQLPAVCAPGEILPKRMLRLEPPDAGTSRAPADVRLMPPNLPLVWNLADCTGYGPLPPRRAERFFSVLEPGSVSGGAGIGTLRKRDTIGSTLMPLLAPDLLVTTERDVTGFAATEDTQDCYVHGALQKPTRVRLYYEHEVVLEEDVAATLLRPGFDPVRTLLVESPPALEPGPRDPNGTAEILEFENGRIRIRTRSSSPALLFVSESWAPGWEFTIDGGESGDTTPAQLMFQAVAVPAGERTLTLEYRPLSFRVGALLSGISLLLLLYLASLRKLSGRMFRDE